MATYRDLRVYVDGKQITDYISFIWTDRYNTCGDFEMEVPFSSANNNFYKADQIVTCNLSKKRMIIETIKISISAEDGKRMLLTGRSYESVLDRRVVALTQVYDNDFFQSDKFMNVFQQLFRFCFGTGNRSQIVTIDNPNPGDKTYKEARVHNNKRYMNLSLTKGNDPNEHIHKAQINIEATNKTMLELLESHCQAKDFGFEVIDNICYIYDGYHRNVEFSLAKGNLISADYSASKEKYKNVAYVQGDEYTASKNKVEVNGVTIDLETLEEGKSVVLTPSQANEEAIYYRTEVDLDSASGLGRREIAIESSKEIGQNSNKKYASRLASEGRVTLLKDQKWNIQTSCEVMYDPNIVYMRDYYLGDIVNIELDTVYDVMDKTGDKYSVKKIKMRVKEYTISHDESGLTLYPTFDTYEEDKYDMSNAADAGIDLTEDPESGYDQQYTKFVRVEFDFNGGHLDPSNTGTLYVPEQGISNKKTIKNADNPVWYVYANNEHPGVVDTDKIQRKFSYQQRGNFVTLVDTIPIKEHYILKGWFLGNTEIKAHTPGDDTTGYLIGLEGDDPLTIFAKWEVKEYEITFDRGEHGLWAKEENQFIVEELNEETGIIEEVVKENNPIIIKFPYGKMPTPPKVKPEKGYKAAKELWTPEMIPVEGPATYTANWEEDPNADKLDDDVDPEGSNYSNEDLPTDGVEADQKSSTITDREKKDSGIGLVHFRSMGSRIGDSFGIEGTELKLLADGAEQAYEWEYVRDLKKDGYYMQAHWFDATGVDYTKFSGSAKWAARNFTTKAESHLGLSIIGPNGIIGLWMWGYTGGGHKLPEVAFSTIPVYIPYFDYITNQEAVNTGKLTISSISNAPIFVPFIFYKKSGSKYSMLCVPPKDWLTKWQTYYMYTKAGNYVGFTCQMYDDAGNLLSPTWIRADKNEYININGEKKEIPYQTTYGGYYYVREDGYNIYTDGPNTIYAPNSRIKAAGSSIRHLSNSWIESGWQWRKIPDARWTATETVPISSYNSTDSVPKLVNYSGPLLIPPEGVSIPLGSTDAGWSIVSGWGTQFYHRATLGMIFGNGFEGYSEYVIKGDYTSQGTYYRWNILDRDINKGAMATSSFVNLAKQSGKDTFSAMVIQQINNVIAKSNSLSYFTYKVALPAIAAIKSTTWYVSKDGEKWHVISWAHGNSVKLKTTNKTVAENEADGLTGADAIVGTNGSKYKAETEYTVDDKSFVNTSDIGTLTIDDSAFSSDIELGDYMNPDGTTFDIDIEDVTDTDDITNGMTFDDVTIRQRLDMKKLLDTGMDADGVAEATGIPKVFVDYFIDHLVEP